MLYLIPWHSPPTSEFIPFLQKTDKTHVYIGADLRQDSSRRDEFAKRTISQAEGRSRLNSGLLAS